MFEMQALRNMRDITGKQKNTVPYEWDFDDKERDSPDHITLIGHESWWMAIILIVS